MPGKPIAPYRVSRNDDYQYSAGAAAFLIGVSARDLYSLVKTGRVQQENCDTDVLRIPLAEIKRLRGGKPVSEKDNEAAVAAHLAEREHRRQSQARRREREDEIKALRERAAIGVLGRSDPHHTAAEAGPVNHTIEVNAGPYMPQPYAVPEPMVSIEALTKAFLERLQPRPQHPVNRLAQGWAEVKQALDDLYEQERDGPVGQLLLAASYSRDPLNAIISAIQRILNP